MIRVLVAFLCLVPALAAAQGGTRIWRDTSGKTITAKFLWADEETLYLKLNNGKEAEVPLGRLSNDDLDFVRRFRAKLKEKGIVVEAPLTWEIYRSKNVSAAAAEKAGAFPLDSQAISEGSLRLEFRRYGKATELAANQRAVLRLRTARNREAGTSSTIKVSFRGKTVGTGTNVPANTTFDIPLSSAVFQAGNSIELTVTCGRDTVHLRTAGSGAGPRLLIVEQGP